MAYTAVKLADVQKAIAAVTAANKKYTDAQASSKTSETAVNTARKALETAQSKLQALQSDFDNQKYLTTNAGYKTANTALTAAEKKLNDARSFLDSGQFLEKNSAYQNALKAIQTAEKNRDAAQTRLDNATDKTRVSLERALTAANKTVDTAYTNADKARAAAEKLAQTSISTAEKAYDTSNANLERARIAAEKAAYIPITNQQKALDSQQKIFDTAQNKYQSLMDSFQPLLDQRNEAINNVSSYIDTIRGSLGDVTKFADAKQVQTLLGQIQTAVKGTKLDDLIQPVTSMISGIDPLKMAAIPKVNIQGANPDVFSNIDPNTGLPILDQGGLDSVLDRYKSNKIDTQQYRDNYDKFGWNVKSDASTAMRGPAVVGLDMGNIQQGISGSTRGIVKAGTNQAASDADFKKAADQLGININDYYTTKETTGAYGTRSTQRVLDQQSLYNDIADRTKDFYMVANSIDGNKHAALLFRADGSGNLIPVTNDRGVPMANYYTATRNVTGETWYGDLLPIAAIAASFALPGIGTAFAQSAAGSALAASIGTTAATAVTNAALSASLAAITGGDVGKAALTAGLSSVANSAQIANKIVGEENIAAIAKAANLTRGQVENIIANGLTEGISTAATGQGDVLGNMAKTVASSFASESARNIATKAVLDADQDTISRVADSVANLTNVGTQAALNGLNPIDAIAASAPYIISSTSGVPVEERAPIEDRQILDVIAALTPEQIASFHPDLNEEQVRSVFESGYYIDPKTGEKRHVVDILGVGSDEDTLPLGALFSKGTSDPNAKYTSVFGTGATGGTSDDFALVARDYKSPDEVITWLESEIPKASPQKQAEIQNTIQKLKSNQPLTPSENLQKVKADASFNAERIAGQAIYGADYIPPDELGKYIEYLRASGMTAPVGLGDISTAAAATQAKPSLYPAGGTGTAGFSYSQYQGLAQNLYKSAGISPTSQQIEKLASQLMSNAFSKSGSQLPGTSGTSLDGQPGGVPGAPGKQPEGIPGASGETLGGLEGGIGTGEEGTGEDAAQKEAALQQYQQYLQRIRTQQQQKTQELVDPKSVYYLTPEEQAARGYINPAELYESITPFKRGGLASMKRNAKWQ